MGRWHDGEGGLAHCEGIRQAHRRGEVGAARSAPDLCRLCHASGARSISRSMPERSHQSFSPEQLDNLLSPVALYPDPLLAQLLVAATFPDQVEEAPRDACRSDGGPALRMTALRKSR